MTHSLNIPIRVLVAAALACLVGASRADAAYPGFNGKIAFERQGEIHTMNPDGSEVTRLTFTRNLVASAVNVQPTWSPDGRRIAFTSNRDGNLNVYVMNADGSAPVQLTADPAADEDPTWSPDGRRIAFMSNRSLGSGPYLSGDKIWVMDADGSNAERANPSAGSDSEPTWSPDGKWIAFTRTQSDGGDVFLQDLDGAMQGFLTTPSVEILPAWSPDGRRIAFVSRAVNADVFAVDFVFGSTPEQLTSAPGFDTFPAWSPDGRQIAFTSTREGEQEVYTMDADGSGETRRTVHTGADSSPDWQPLRAA